ncbi:unnamed protein product [Prorocentrum cordatum]|uniref:Uncharacterized protein n=1 Tax=Prorocentrum cordatum TaxID=2364126 RepID=A0ABN9S8U2_9DINO|nr:unnamed protein product [Polarella glacialis]
MERGPPAQDARYQLASAPVVCTLVALLVALPAVLSLRFAGWLRRQEELAARAAGRPAPGTGSFIPVDAPAKVPEEDEPPGSSRDGSDRAEDDTQRLLVPGGAGRAAARSPRRLRRRRSQGAGV